MHLQFGHAHAGLQFGILQCSASAGRNAELAGEFQALDARRPQLIEQEIWRRERELITLLPGIVGEFPVGGSNRRAQFETVALTASPVPSNCALRDWIGSPLKVARVSDSFPLPIGLASEPFKATSALSIPVSGACTPTA